MDYPNIRTTLEQALHEGNRKPDGLLHCSKHTWWPLRFTQLEFAGHKMAQPELLDQITMLTGTLHHQYMEEALKKHSDKRFELVATEIDLTPHLPSGWTGTADWLFYDNQEDHCVLGDYKTIKPEGIQYLNGQPKLEHVLQLSAYYYALEAAGYTMAPNFFVFYLPKGRLWSHKIEPAQLASPPEEHIFDMMNQIRNKTLNYTNGIGALHPMPSPVYKRTWNKVQNVFDVKQHPDWTEAYTCPFSEDICPRTPIKKVGHWTLDRKWESKTGISSLLRPTDMDFRKRGG